MNFRLVYVTLTQTLFDSFFSLLNNSFLNYYYKDSILPLLYSALIFTTIVMRVINFSMANLALKHTVTANRRAVYSGASAAPAVQQTLNRGGPKHRLKRASIQNA